MGHKARIATILFGLALSSGFLGYVAFHQLYKRGLQAEAKLMISYVHTLEKVYKLEKHVYAFWDEPYGAALHGTDNCEQPEGAAEIGFYVPGCHRLGAPVPRYSYRILREQQGEGYRVEATAGSDAAGRSVICFDEQGEELWQSSQSHDFTQTVSCW